MTGLRKISVPPPLFLPSRDSEATCTARHTWHSDRLQSQQTAANCRLQSWEKEAARKDGQSPARGRLQARAGDAEGRSRRARTGCARRRRVTSVRHVPVFTSLVEEPTSAAKWQHCGDSEAQSLGDASLRQAGSGRWGRREEGGGAGRSAWTSGRS